MSEAKHTQGPWFVDPSDTTAVRKQFRSPRIVNEKVCGVRFAWMTQGEKEANARLIAAAPELLEALQAIHDSAPACWWSLPIEQQQRIKEAIAKATGEPS